MKAEYCKGKGLFVHIVPRLSIVKDYAHNRSNDSNYFRMSWNHRVSPISVFSIDREKSCKVERKDVLYVYRYVERK